MINANKAKQDREVTDDVREKPATIVPFAPMRARGAAEQLPPQCERIHNKRESAGRSGGQRPDLSAGATT
jgi:hypothetical protein